MSAGRCSYVCGYMHRFARDNHDINNSSTEIDTEMNEEGIKNVIVDIVINNGLKFDKDRNIWLEHALIEGSHDTYILPTNKFVFCLEP